jgi:hypothetical protein
MASSAASSMKEKLIEHLEKTPYNYDYDTDERYFLCRVRRSDGSFTTGVVCESMICANTVHVNVWPKDFVATADSSWPNPGKLVPFKDFLVWNTPVPTTEQK